MSAPGALPSRRARAEASAWIAKLHGPDRSDALERDFRSWLAVDPEHARAFEHITDVWDGIRQVNTGGLPRLAGLDTFEPPAGARRWPLLAAAAACVVLIIGSVGLLSWTDRSYETHLGDQRIVTLEDGSRLYLNSQTRIDVSFDEHIRRVELDRGEAYFEVAKDASRPFIVDAGGRYVTALGTAFVVRLESHQVAVTLVEGKVSVTSGETVATSINDDGAHAAETNTVILSPGERVTVSETRAVIDTPRSDATAAWRRGEVVLDETPLGSAVTELNRYQRRQLVVADAQLAQLPVSGTYQIGNNLDFAQAVALLYGLQVSEAGDDIRLSRAR